MKLNLLLVFVLLSFYVSAQTNTVSQKPDNRLKEVFTPSQLEGMVLKNPFMIQRYNYYLDNSWRLIDLPVDKSSTAKMYKTVKIADLSSVNIFILEKDQNLKRSWDGPVYYHIDGTNKLLMLDGEKDFTYRLNKALGRVK